jgi:hypothetical protein
MPLGNTSSMVDLFTVPGNGANGIPPGSHFVADHRIVFDQDLLCGMTEEDFKGWVFRCFRAAYAAKKPETERLKTLEMYYSGFHFLDPQMNREMKVTNLCFSTVETVHPVMTEQTPRPEVVMRRQYTPDVASKLQEYACWLMDTTEFDLNHHLNTREKLKYGWCVHLLVVDPATGMCWPKPWSVFDFYKDPYARHEDEMEWFFLASPVPTAWLREHYPECAEEIFADNIASPAYDALERPYYDAFSAGGGYDSLDGIMGGHFGLEGPLYSGMTSDNSEFGGQPLVTPEEGRMQDTGTTFTLQMFVRDRRRIPVHYSGQIASQQQGELTFTYAPTAKNYVRNEPCSESGWVCIPVTASGALLKPHAVDACFLGAPIEIGRDYAQAGRFYCPGEMDHIIPINRSINRRYNLLNRSLEFEAVPILLADSDSGVDIDQRAVEPGDVLKKVRGSSIQWLEFGGAAAQQFTLLNMEALDVDKVSGVQDVSQGRRPEGIEAASAIRNLQEAAQTRIRGKEGPAFIEYTRLLKKMMVATGKKCKQPIYFRARNGEQDSIDPAWLRYEYDIRFAKGSGTLLGRAANEDKYLQLAQTGLIDQQTALEAFDVPNIPTIMQRLAAQQLIARNAAAAQNGGSKNGKGSPQPANA